MPRTLHSLPSMLTWHEVARGTHKTFIYSRGPYIFQKSWRRLQISCAKVATRQIFRTEELHFRADTWTSFLSGAFCLGVCLLVKQYRQVRVTLRWDSFVQPLVLGKTNKYYMFWLCVFVTLGTQHVCPCAISLSLSCPAVKYFSTSNINGRFSKKKVGYWK
jgi:hypothetical protein